MTTILNHRTRLLLLAALVLGALGLSACAHKQLDTGSLDRVQRLAIVARVSAKPAVDAARVDPVEGRAYPMETPADADKALATELARQVGHFELEERLRTALVQRLPAAPPWSTAMPGVEVSTALDSLLVEDRSGPPDYDALARRGSNSVLEISVEEYGLRHVKGKTALYIKGQARMFLINGSTLWKAPIDLDDAVDPQAETLDVVALRQGGYRDALVSLVNRLADRLAGDLLEGAK